MSVKAIVAAFFCSHGGTPLFSYLSVNITIICILSIPYFIYPLQCLFDLSSIFYVLVQMLSNFRALCHFTCKGRHFFPGNFVKTALFSPAHPSAFCRGPPLFPKGASVNTRVAATGLLLPRPLWATGLPEKLPKGPLGQPKTAQQKGWEADPSQPQSFFVKETGVAILCAPSSELWSKEAPLPRK